MIRLSGRLRSALIIGLQGIRARKLRTLLSMVSLFLGVLAVVVVQAASQIAEQAYLADVELTEGIDGTMQAYLGGGPEITPILLDAVKGHPEAVLLTSIMATIGEPNVTPINPGGQPFENLPAYGGGTQAGPGSFYCEMNGYCYPVPGSGDAPPPPGQAIDLNLTSMTSDVRAFRPFRHVSGDWLDFSGPPSLSPRIVLNKEAALGFATYRVPAQMHIPNASADATPRIIGVVDDGGQTPNAYVRSDELLNWLPATSPGNANYGMPQQLMMSPDATDLALVINKRMTAAGIPGGLQLNPINARERIETALKITRWLFLGLAGLVLLIGVAGILNVGLATVGERIEEFALRRAVGTPRLLLAGIVLAETLLTGLFTATAAIAVAAGALKVAATVVQGRVNLPADLVFPWQAAVAGVIAGIVAGVLGGLIPAIRAARIPIATVMRA